LKETNPDEGDSEQPSSTPNPSASSSAKRPSVELWSKKIRAGEEIGRGGMATIVSGTDVMLHRELALKVLPADREGELLARFVEEAQITAQLEHPNVVPVHELGVDPDGRAYFSMKLVRGRSLEEILEERRLGDSKTRSEFGLRQLLDVFLKVCQAVEYAHARGVIHRDLKPANIMVGSFGEVLVMDWGVAKLIDPGRGNAERVATELSAALAAAGHAADEAALRSRESFPPRPSAPDIKSYRFGKAALETRAGSVVGTPEYMSPEQARGAAVDERSDLYSLGVILYEILCGERPFEDEDATRVLVRMLTESPRRPCEINPATPLALETLALRLLEKEPAQRALTLPRVRAHVQDHIEGIGRDYHQGSVWSNVLWMAGSLVLFAFLVWYLSRQSISALFVLAPATVFNAFGWFLVILAVGFPLWAAYLALKFRGHRDRFGDPTADEQFLSGYLAHRTFATALAPVFQLIFTAEIARLAILQALSGQVSSGEHVRLITTELRAEWAQSLIVILISLFVYLFFLSGEVRFARQIDNYDALVARLRWEAVWPFFLIIVLLLTIGTTHGLDWTFAGHRGGFGEFLIQKVLTPPVDLLDIGKTLLFQGTFLFVLVLALVFLAFPPPEVFAATRLRYQPGDEATVQRRQTYLVRSVAIFRLARVYWLYGGVMIGTVTALTILSRPAAEPLVYQLVYVLGPSLIGFAGYTITRRYVRSLLGNSPAVEQLIERRIAAFRIDLARVTTTRLEQSARRTRILQFVFPFACILIYVLWAISGIHRQAIQQLIVPATIREWLLILPYVILVPALLLRDPVQLAVLRRRLRNGA
jgi:serine/threonine protein kinase